MSGHAEHHGDDHGSDHGGPGLLTKLTQVRGAVNQPTPGSVIMHTMAATSHAIRSLLALPVVGAAKVGTLAFTVPSNTLGALSNALNAGGRVLSNTGASVGGAIAGQPPKPLPSGPGGGGHDDHIGGHH